MREPLRLVRSAPRPAARPRAADALELIALAAGIALALSLAAALPSWRTDLGRFQALAAVAFAFWALALARRHRWQALPHAGAAVVVVAFVLRAAVLGTSPSLSDDVYRYVWEGRVLAAGHDPWREPPRSPALAPLRDAAIWPRVNHPDLRTLYPPLAEAGFALVARVSPTVAAMKLWIALHDLALCALLAWWCGRAGPDGRGRPLDAIVYAWNPLPVIEYAGSGHHDPTALVWLVLALAVRDTRPLLSALALAAGALVKLVPLLALPFLWARWPWRARLAALAVLAAGLAFFGLETRGAGSGLDAFATTWRDNDSLFALLAATLGDRRARLAAAAIVAAVIAWALRRRQGAPRGTRAAARAMLVAGPVMHPWYLGWPLVLEPLAPSPPWLLLGFTALLDYGTLAPPAAGGAYHPTVAARALEYGLPLALAAVLALGARRRAGGR
ncbi:MAG TPA: glycosyltransferase 87 family protein [Candidatus Eisenbacteria bacterium]|nr:glycosyltransferase 87 family protein [Candidatus Eisenbacteria bacterium]